MNSQPKTKPRIAVYARISPTPESEVGKNYSIRSQLEALVKRAGEMGCARPLEFIDDNYSGASLDRPALESMRELIRARALDVVLAHSQDRLFRNLAHGLLLREEALKHGVALEFLSGNYENTPEGRLMYSVQGVISEFEREKFRERSARGRRQKAREGYVSFSQPPYGYRYVGKKDGCRGRLDPHPEQAPIVRRMFEWAAGGMTMYQIRERLNAERIPSPKGKLWSRKSVYMVLSNTAHRGRVRGSGVACPANVDARLFEVVEAQLCRNRTARVGRPSRKYLLRGLLWCSRCGRRCTTFPNHGNPQYRCGNISIHQYRRRCDGDGVSQVRIESAVWDAIHEALTSPQTLWLAARAYHEQMSSIDGAARAKAERAIEALRRREQRAIELLECPEVPLAEARRKLQAIRAELAAALEANRHHIAPLPKRAALSAITERFRESCDLKGYEGRRGVLERLSVKARYSDDLVEIDANLPVETAKNCYHEEPPGNNSLASIPFKITRRVA